MTSPDKNNRGFTLVELMTALAVFIVVMTISMGSIINVFDANRKARSMRTALANLSLAVDTMSREMRFGRDYHCAPSGTNPPTPPTPQNCALGNDLISFLSSANSDIMPSGDDVQITYSLVNGRIMKDVEDPSYVGPIAITAPEIAIDDLTFHVFGAPTGDGLHPRVLIKVQGHVGEGGSRTDFTLQTSVSQRASNF